jgi:Sensors of blue-light using FAD
MKSLISVIYASRATREFHEHEIPHLLKQARLANAAHELTGMLLYMAGSFVQVLEGEEGMVEAVFETIRADKRHGQVALISREPILERAFEGWTLSHKTLDPVEAGELMGEASFFLSPAWIQQLDPPRAKKLLSAASTRWKIEHRSGKYRTLGRGT